MAQRRFVAFEWVDIGHHAIGGQLKTSYPTHILQKRVGVGVESLNEAPARGSGKFFIAFNEGRHAFDQR